MDLAKKWSAKELKEMGGALLPESLGPLDVMVDNFSSFSSGNSTSFGFINSPKTLAAAEDSALACIIAPLKLKDKIESLNSKKTWLLSPNVDLAAREVKKAVVFPTPYRAAFSGIHPTAVIDPTVEIGLGVTIGPHVVIAKNVKIGEGCFIGANAVIEENVTIKSQTTIHPLAYIGHSCEIGHNCEIMPQACIGSEGYGYAHDQRGNHYRIPHTGRVILEDDVHVGASSAIDRGTIEDSHIGQGTKIDNHVHLAHNTVIGKNGLITAHVVVAGSSTIGDNFMVGGNSAINGHIKITDNVSVAGFSGIANDVREPGQYGGYPLVPLKKHLKAKASLVHLPEFRKQMNRVLRKLFPEDFES